MLVEAVKGFAVRHIVQGLFLRHTDQARYRSECGMMCRSSLHLNPQVASPSSCLHSNR
jgi:hypothetical protein